MAPKRKAPACAKVEGETADGIKYVRHESGMLVIGTSSSRRTVRHAGDDVEARVEQELGRDGGALQKLLAPLQLQAQPCRPRRKASGQQLRRSMMQARQPQCRQLQCRQPQSGNLSPRGRSFCQRRKP